MRIPQHIVDGKSPPFPAGTFEGALGEVKDEWYPSDRKNKPDTNDSFRLAIGFTDIATLDGPTVGKRPLIQRIDIIRAGHSLVDVTEFNDDVPFSLRQSATLLSQLAIAVGAATPAADGSGLDVNMEQFIEQLQAKLFQGRRVVFEVQQRTYDSKTNKNADGSAQKVTTSNIVGFSAQAQSDVAAA